MTRSFSRAFPRSLVVVVAVLAAGLLGCDRSDGGQAGGGSGGSGGTKKLYWVQAVKGHPVHQMTQIAFSEAARNLGYEPVIVGTDGPDIAGTVSMAEQALATGQVAGMAVWTGNPAYNPLIARAKNAGVPVILPHFPMKPEEAAGARGVIACDPAAYAAVAAEKIGGRINGKGSVAITQGSFNTTENLVAKTFTDTMKQKYPEVKVLAPVEEGFDTVAAASKASSLIRANPDLAAAFSTTGGGPMTWAAAQRDTAKKLVVVGMDYTRANLDLVKSGDIYALIGQPLWEESRGAAELLDKCIKGQPVEWWTRLDAPFITRDDLAPHYERLEKVDALVKQ